MFTNDPNISHKLVNISKPPEPLRRLLQSAAEPAAEFFTIRGPQLNIILIRIKPFGHFFGNPRAFVPWGVGGRKNMFFTQRADISFIDFDMRSFDTMLLLRCETGKAIPGN